MSLPTITGYPMPTDLPTPRVDWQPDPARAALLIHDMQTYFLRPFPAQQQPITDLLRNIAAIRSCCSRLGIPVFYTAQPGDQDPRDRALLTDFWGPGLTADPAITAITDELAPDPGQPVLTKWRYSAFQRTDLAARLADAGRDQLIVTGVYAHIGVLASCLEAYMRDVQPFLVADAVADFSRDDHELAIDWVSRRCGVVVGTEKLITGLDGPSAPFTVDQLQQQVAAILQVDPAEIEVDESLIDVGLDSIRVMSLVESWRRDGIEVGFAELAEAPTITGWQRLLADRTAAAPVGAAR